MNRAVDSSPVGLVPAAGEASRLGALPCSKEVFPLGPVDAEAADPRGIVAAPTPAERLLSQMARAGARTAYVVIRAGKWDIPAQLGSGERAGLRTAYVMMRRPHGVPFTLEDAYPFVRGSVVLFGFPDVLFQPHDAFVSLQGRLDETGADVVIGTVRARRPETMDMLDLDADGRIRGIEIKPETTDLERSWLLAVWGPAFTEFLHGSLEESAGRTEGTGGGGELHLGETLVDAARSHLSVETLHFPDAEFVDIGTPEGLRRGIEMFPSWAGPSTRPAGSSASR